MLFAFFSPVVPASLGWWWRVDSDGAAERL
jgi:hypothetical protein